MISLLEAGPVKTLVTQTGKPVEFYGHDVAAVVVPIVLGLGDLVATFSDDKFQPKKNSYSIIASVSNTRTNKFQSVLRGNVVG